MSRQNLWATRELQRLKLLRGNRCETCGDPSFDLEFAHLAPTGLKGEGRGKQARMLDIRKQPEKYKLLCMACHDQLDGRIRRKKQTELWRTLKYDN